jgi:cytochrome c oxidase subunit 3
MLSPLYILIHLWLVIILLNSYDISLKNTNLLSNSAIILGNHYVVGVGLMLGYLCSYLFIEDQVNELTGVTSSMNDTLIGWLFYSLDGWHLYHVVVGILLLMICIKICSWTQYLFGWLVISVRVRLHHMFCNMQLVYWHFVELLWLVIYYVLYS